MCPFKHIVQCQIHGKEDMSESSFKPIWLFSISLLVAPTQHNAYNMITRWRTYLMCAGQGSNEGLSICLRWGKFSAAKSSLRSTSPSVLCSADFLQPGTKVKSCSRNRSCRWGLALPLMKSIHLGRSFVSCDNSSQITSRIVLFNSSPQSDPGHLLCKASAPAQQQPFLFIKKDHSH